MRSCGGCHLVRSHLLILLRCFTYWASNLPLRFNDMVCLSTVCLVLHPTPFFHRHLSTVNCTTWKRTNYRGAATTFRFFGRQSLSKYRKHRCPSLSPSFTSRRFPAEDKIRPSPPLPLPVPYLLLVETHGRHCKVHE